MLHDTNQDIFFLSHAPRAFLTFALCLLSHWSAEAEETGSEADGELTVGQVQQQHRQHHRHTPGMPQPSDVQSVHVWDGRGGPVTSHVRVLPGTQNGAQNPGKPADAAPRRRSPQWRRLLVVSESLRAQSGRSPNTVTRFRAAQPVGLVCRLWEASTAELCWFLFSSSVTLCLFPLL